MPDLPPFPPDPDAPDAPASAEPSNDADQRQERFAAGDDPESEVSAQSGLDELRQVLITRLGETQQSLLGLIEHFQAEQRHAAGQAESQRLELEQELAALRGERDDQARALEAGDRERAEQREALAAAEQARAEAEQGLEAARARAGETPPRVEPASELVAIRRAIAALDAATTQTEVLSRLLEEATAHAGRAALLLPKDGADRLDVWNATGFGDALEPGGQAEPPESLRRALEGRSIAGDDARWEVDDLAPTDAVGIPLILRDRVRAVLYADRTDGDQPFAADALQILTYCAAGALETLPLRSIRPAGTLVDVSPALSLEPAVEPAVESALDEDRSAGASAASVALDAPPSTEAAEIEAPELAAPEIEAPEIEAPEIEAPEAEDAESLAGPEPLAAGLSEETAEEATSAEEVAAPTAQPGESFPPGAASPWASAAEATAEETTSEGWSEVLAASAPPAALEAESELEIDAEDDNEDENEDESEIAAGSWDLLEEPEPAGHPTLAVPPPLPSSSSPATREAEGATVAEWATPVAEPAPEEDEDETIAEAGAEERAVAETRDDLAEAPPPRMAREADESPLEAAGDGPGPRPSPFARAALDEDDEEHDDHRADVEQFRTQAIHLDQISARAPGAERAQPRSSEVVPPSDVQGPGWAFTGAALGGPSAANEDPMHEEARRLARLLVSEIKLYNEEQIEEGRRQGNIYRFLKEPIDRSRVLYEERIDARVRSDSDYYQEELIRSLANGDRSLLGL
jgi:hypothetical protein